MEANFQANLAVYLRTLPNSQTSEIYSAWLQLQEPQEVAVEAVTAVLGGDYDKAAKAWQSVELYPQMLANSQATSAWLSGARRLGQQAAAAVPGVAARTLANSSTKGLFSQLRAVGASAMSVSKREKNATAIVEAINTYFKFVQEAVVPIYSLVHQASPQELIRLDSTPATAHAIPLRAGMAPQAQIVPRIRHGTRTRAERSPTDDDLSPERKRIRLQETPYEPMEDSATAQSARVHDNAAALSSSEAELSSKTTIEEEEESKNEKGTCVFHASRDAGASAGDGVLFLSQPELDELNMPDGAEFMMYVEPDNETAPPIDQELRAMYLEVLSTGKVVLPPRDDAGAEKPENDDDDPETPVTGVQHTPLDEEGRVPKDRRSEKKKKAPAEGMESLPDLSTRPPIWEPMTSHLTQERMNGFKLNEDDFLQTEERKLLRFVVDRTYEYFDPIKMGVVCHRPSEEPDRPIHPGIGNKLIEPLKQKIAGGVYESSNSAYPSGWSAVVKKTGKSLRIVHDLRRLNSVTIRDARTLPSLDEFFKCCAGRTVIGALDQYSSYDLQLVHPAS
ncbi:hypothetical protein BKA62DRAFT_780013, partial [Auriculariales sp. MPI-PUGE-AT-0066]